MRTVKSGALRAESVRIKEGPDLLRLTSASHVECSPEKKTLA